MTKKEFAEICGIIGETMILIAEQLKDVEKKPVKKEEEAKDNTIITNPKEEKVKNNINNDIPEKDDFKEDYHYNKNSKKYQYVSDSKHISTTKKDVEKIKESQNLENIILDEFKKTNIGKALSNKGIYINKEILNSISEHAQDIASHVRELKYIRNEEAKRIINYMENDSVNIIAAIHDLRKMITEIK